MLPRYRFRLLPVRSPLLGKSFLFLEVLRCFSSLRAPRYAYVFSVRCPSIPPGGFPHSDIFGSLLAGSSPKLFAAYHVLHRPLAPRHPPCALVLLFNTSYKTNSVQFLRCKSFAGGLLDHAGPFPHPPVEMRGLEPLASSVQGRRSPI